MRKALIPIVGLAVFLWTAIMSSCTEDAPRATTALM